LIKQISSGAHPIPKNYQIEWIFGESFGSGFLNILVLFGSRCGLLFGKNLVNLECFWYVKFSPEMMVIPIEWL